MRRSWPTSKQGTVQSKPMAKVPWTRVFRSGTLWALFVMYFCSALRLLLLRDLDAHLPDGGARADARALRLVGGSADGHRRAGLSGGRDLLDWLIRRLGSLKWGRRIVGVGGYGLAAVGFGVAAQARDPFSAVLGFRSRKACKTSPARSLGDLRGRRRTARRYGHGIHEHRVEHVGDGLADHCRLAAPNLPALSR